MPDPVNEEAIEITFQVISVLDALEVKYLLGGSLASAIYGEPRATRDADIVTQIGPEHVPKICELLTPTFNVSEESIWTAIKYKSSFNVIHFESLFKVDLFVSKNRLFEQQEFQRRVLRLVSVEPERFAYVATAEDIIIAKLEWFRLGNEVSERQWRDITSVFKANSKSLDINYLIETAKQLELLSLLKRLLP